MSNMFIATIGWGMIHMCSYNRVINGICVAIIERWVIYD